MALREDFEKSGNWLFRWRSYLPLLFLGALLIGTKYFEYADNRWEGLWEIFCVAVAFFGQGIRAYTIGCTPRGTSGRNTFEQQAETLNTTGIYSIVRHPLYLGNFFCFLGIALFGSNGWGGLTAVLLFWIYYERIMFAEEEYLWRKFGEQYEQWADNTPAFFPKLNNWESPDLPFSFRNVLKREYSGFLAIIASFALLEFSGDVFVEGQLERDSMMWLFLLCGGVITYLILRTLKKTTKTLHVEGR